MGKILVVEDNDMNLDMLMRRLARKGHEIIIAVNGKQAIAKAESEQPKLILMDLSLPVMDGWEATRLLKVNKNTRHIPVIVLTAHAFKSDHDKALEAGCDDYDTKPINFPRLYEKIESQLRVDNVAG